jgi:hypothetical protein
MSADSTDQSSAPALLLAGSHLEPYQVTRTQLDGMFNSPTQVKRMIHAGWIVPVRPGKPGREALFDYQSTKAAFARLQAGEQPPPVPPKAKNQVEEEQ